MPDRKKLAAYTLPMLLFVGLLGLNSLLKKIDNRFWLSSAEYWIYPAQTILCAGLLLWFRREYRFSSPDAANLCGLDCGCRLFALDIAPGIFWICGAHFRF